MSQKELPQNGNQMKKNIRNGVKKMEDLVESILDYVPASLKLNGSTENVKVGKESTPVLKEVLIDA